MVFYTFLVMKDIAWSAEITTDQPDLEIPENIGILGSNFTLCNILWFTPYSSLGGFIIFSLLLKYSASACSFPSTNP